MILQLNPQIPLETPKGRGYASLLIDYSQEHDLLWVCFLDESGECWTFRNSEVRAQKNLSLGRKIETELIQGVITELNIPRPKDYPPVGEMIVT